MVTLNGALLNTLIKSRGKNSLQYLRWHSLNNRRIQNHYKLEPGALLSLLMDIDLRYRYNAFRGTFPWSLMSIYRHSHHHHYLLLAFVSLVHYRC